jgi:uncharacterized protein YodC (DUF2158 family)
LVRLLLPSTIGCEIDVGTETRESAHMADYKEGDTVRLKSGGPIMTVAGTTTTGALECHWFNHSGADFTHQYQTFRPTMLKSVTVSS